MIGQSASEQNFHRRSGDAKPKNVNSPDENSHASGSQAATMVVCVKDEFGKAMKVGSLTVLVSGKGLLGTGTGPATEFKPTGRAVSVSPSRSVPGRYVFALFGSGVRSL